MHQKYFASWFFFCYFHICQPSYNSFKIIWEMTSKMWAEWECMAERVANDIAWQANSDYFHQGKLGQKSKKIHNFIRLILWLQKVSWTKIAKQKLRFQYTIWWQHFSFMSDLFLTSFISTAKSFSSWNKIGLLKNDPAASSYATDTLLMVQSYKTFFSAKV